MIPSCRALEMAPVDVAGDDEIADRRFVVEASR
jgi:hypothetical protein